jgi:hypothetical protein
MRVTVTAELDDGQEMKLHCDVDSGENQRFWSKGFIKGAVIASDGVRRLIETRYGSADENGLHLV